MTTDISWTDAVLLAVIVIQYFYTMASNKYNDDRYEILDHKVTNLEWYNKYGKQARTKNHDLD